MGAKPRVLIVDDSPQVRDFYRLVLRKMQCEPTAAASGADALKYIENVPRPFSLVILDLLMPGKSGWDTLVQIRKIAAYQNVPIIVITGIDLPDEQIARLREYCQQVLVKSNFSLMTLKKVVETYL